VALPRAGDDLAAHRGAFPLDGLNAGLGHAGYDGLWQLIDVTLMMLAGAFLAIDSGLFLHRSRRAFRAGWPATPTFWSSSGWRPSH
jgi:hypothetical protein